VATVSNDVSVTALEVLADVSTTLATECELLARLAAANIVAFEIAATPFVSLNDVAFECNAGVAQATGLSFELLQVIRATVADLFELLEQLSGDLAVLAESLSSQSVNWDVATEMRQTLQRTISTAYDVLAGASATVQAAFEVSGVRLSAAIDIPFEYRGRISASLLAAFELLSVPSSIEFILFTSEALRFASLTLESLQQATPSAEAIVASNLLNESVNTPDLENESLLTADVSDEDVEN
jgi:hypothetical protein